MSHRAAQWLGVACMALIFIACTGCTTKPAKDPHQQMWDELDIHEEQCSFEDLSTDELTCK